MRNVGGSCADAKGLQAWSYALIPAATASIEEAISWSQGSTRDTAKWP